MFLKLRLKNLSYLLFLCNVKRHRCYEMSLEELYVLGVYLIVNILNYIVKEDKVVNISNYIYSLYLKSNVLDFAERNLLKNYYNDLKFCKKIFNRSHDCVSDR